MVVRWPGGQDEKYALNQPVIQVGRAEDNDIVLNFPTVSGHHLRLEVGPDSVQVTDLHSTNGTLLKGRLIEPGKPHPWRAGETLRVGDLRGNSISMVLEGLAAPPLHTYPLGMQQLAQYPTVVLGRDPASQVTLDHPTISRHHAEIVQHSGGHAIRDLGSFNGTFVNGQRVTNLTPLQMGDVIQIGPYKLVYDGQAERLTTSISQGHRLDAMGLGFEVSGNRMILEDISLSVQGSEFAALVGGSGAGKSTLMKAMNGFQPANHGQMLIDGEPLYPNLDTYRTLMGYVPQDDIIHKALPVRSALWYAAKLRLPDATQEEIERRIDNVLEMVEMKAHEHKPVKVLSGGQRKRVSIAVELLAEPDLLFLDEPTSGLDPGLEKKMMYDLNRLADQGRTIVLVTHATANIEQCDHVAFLVRGNLAYYGPPAEAISFFEAQDFADIYLKLSEEVNPAEGKLPAPELQPYQATVEQRLGGNGGSQSLPAGLLWAEHYRRSPLHQRYVEDRQPQVTGASGARATSDQPASRGARDSALRQLFILARRQFDLIRHDMRTLFILLLMMPLIASLFMFVSGADDLTGWQLSPARVEETLLADLKAEVGVTDEEELTAEDVGESTTYLPAPQAMNLIMMLGLALTQAGTFGAAFEIVKERPIFRRERAVNLKVGSYVLSKVLILGLFAVVQVASSLLILSFKVDLGFDPVFSIFPSGGAEMFVTLLLAVMASIMLGLFISAIVPSADVVLYIILVQLFVQIILSGSALFPLPESALTDAISQAVISHWTMEGMGASVGIEELNEESMVCQVGESQVVLPDGSTETHYGFGCDTESAGVEELGLNYAHTEKHLLTVWGALVAQIVLWGVLTMVMQMRTKTD
jgi:ABC-type multidrug transport system ATPase subunit